MALAERPLYAGLEQPLPVPVPELERARSSRRQFMCGLAALIVAGGCLMGAAAGATAVAETGYQLDQAKQHLAQVQAEHRQLQLSVAQLRSLPRVQAAATHELGMHEPPAYDTVPMMAVHDAQPSGGHQAVIALGPRPASQGPVWAFWHTLSGAATARARAAGAMVASGGGRHVKR